MVCWANHMSNQNRDFIECDICHKPIYREDGEYDGDDYYETEDGDICEDCIRDYIRSKRRVLR